MGIVLVTIVVHMVLAWLMRYAGIAWGEDDARFVILARELASGSYQQAWLVDAPVEARFPPGFPALLALANAVFGEHLTVHLALVNLCSAISLLLLFDIARRRIGLDVALFVTLLTALNPIVLRDAGEVMSEAPFRLFATLTLWAVTVDRDDRRLAIVAAIAASYSALIRTAGIAVIGALACQWGLGRRWARLAGVALASVPVAIWLRWTVVAPDGLDQAAYLHDPELLSAPSPIDRINVLAARAASNGFLYLRQMVPESVGFFHIREFLLDNVLWALLVAVTVPIGLLVLWRRARPVAWFVLAYAGVLLAWRWVDVRFVGPAIGFWLLLMATGIAAFGGRWGLRGRRVALAVVAPAFLLGAWQIGAPRFRSAVACDRADRTRSPTCYPEDHRGYLQLAEYVREHTSPEAVFFAPKEGGFYLNSGRRLIRDVDGLSVPADSLGAYLRRRGVTHAVVTPVGLEQPTHNRAIMRACREFELERAFVGQTYLLRVRPDGPSADDVRVCTVVGDRLRRSAIE